MRSSFKLTKSYRRSLRLRPAHIDHPGLVLLRRELLAKDQVTLKGATGREVIELALSTFNDSGTTGAELDEELREIDDLLETVGYEPGNATRDLKRLIQRCRRAEKQIKPVAASKTRRRKSS